MGPAGLPGVQPPEGRLETPCHRHPAAVVYLHRMMQLWGAAPYRRIERTHGAQLPEGKRLLPLQPFARSQDFAQVLFCPFCFCVCSHRKTPLVLLLRVQQPKG